MRTYLDCSYSKTYSGCRHAHHEERMSQCTRHSKKYRWRCYCGGWLCRVIGPWSGAASTVTGLSCAAAAHSHTCKFWKLDALVTILLKLRSPIDNPKQQMHALVRNKLHAVKGPQVHCVRVSAYFLTMLFSGRCFDCFALVLAVFSCPSNDLWTSMSTARRKTAKLDSFLENGIFFFTNTNFFCFPENRPAPFSAHACTQVHRFSQHSPADSAYLCETDVSMYVWQEEWRNPVYARRINSSDLVFKSFITPILIYKFCL